MRVDISVLHLERSVASQHASYQDMIKASSANGLTVGYYATFNQRETSFEQL